MHYLERCFGVCLFVLLLGLVGWELSRYNALRKDTTQHGQSETVDPSIPSPTLYQLSHYAPIRLLWCHI